MATRLTGISTFLAFNENIVNGAAQIIDSTVTFTSSDTIFNGSQVIVQGLLTEDTISIHSQGTDTGQISYAGDTLSYSGTAIGTVSGGAGSTLIITFNGDATASALEALIENLTYANTSDNPTVNRAFMFSYVSAPLSFVEQGGSDNPLNFGTGFNHSKAALADVDGDGDLDAVVGGRDGAHPIGGTLKYFRNTGTATSPHYEEQTTAETNPFYGIDTGWDSAPSLADLDKDGDLDAVVRTGGTFKYFKNTGTATSPQYVEQVTAETNPFNGIDDGGNSAFTLADVDADGDIDAVVGRGDGTLWYFKNTGSMIAPQYVQQTDSDNPFNGIDAGENSAPALADVDRDGDLDAVVGEYSGTLKYFENVGSAIAPQYVEQTGTDNPFNGIDVGYIGDYNFSTPTLADLDRDGNIDAIVGEYWGTMKYFQGTGGGAVTSAIAVVAVTAENDGPVAQDDSASLAEDASTSGYAFTNDSDADGGALSISLVQGTVVSSSGATIQGAYGTLTIKSDGTYTYKADRANGLIEGESGTDSFTCVVSDGSLSDEAVLTLTVQGSDEALTGTAGNNTLTGGRGADVLKGLAGNDVVKGMDGNDTLHGGLGTDTLVGGTGSGSRDTFVFNTGLKSNVDKVTDFESKYDQIYLDDAVFAVLVKGTVAGTQITKSMFVANTSGQATAPNKAQLVYETDTGKLFYDKDGNGSAATVHFATLSGKPALSYLDFEII
jgi:VCBS repeat-containing protein